MTDREALARMELMAKGGTNFSDRSRKACEIALAALREKMARPKPSSSPGKYESTLSNADRIRAMSDEELAEFLAYKWEPESKAWMREYGETIGWLCEPAEEEHHG